MKARSGADPRGDRRSPDDYAASYWNRGGGGGRWLLGGLFLETNHTESIQFDGVDGIFTVSRVALFFSVRTSEIVNATLFRIWLQTDT